MKTLKATRTLTVPDGVTVTVKSRVVTVTGPRGTLKRDFGHLSIDLTLVNNGRGVRADLWFGRRQSLACIRTILAHINNMIVGVTKGYLFKMRLVYNHFPISVNVENNGKEVQVRNYLGEKEVRIVNMRGDVTCKRSEDGTKDEIIISGNDLDDVSQSAANIHQCALVKDKDIRKFLDGVYVSYRGNIVTED
jgi:large subunit ribosomal protein L9e